MTTPTRIEFALDQRGSDDVPYGYLNGPREEYRIGFSCENGIIGIWAGNWGPVHPNAWRDAKAFLAERFPNYKIQVGRPY